MLRDAITIDFETRSRCDIRKHGISKYARDPSTRALCMAYRQHGETEPRIWHPLVGVNAYSDELRIMPIPSLILQALEEGWEFHAHNAPFEIYIWHFVMGPQHGWPDVDLRRWRCTAAKAAHANMPRALEDVGRFLNQTDQQKDKEGHKLMVSMAKPRKLTKKLIAAGAGEWVDDGVSHTRLRRYCKRDVITEDGVDRKLPVWDEREIELWHLDREINMEGVPVDIKLCRGAVEILKVAKVESEKELALMTGGVEVPPGYKKVKGDKRKVLHGILGGRVKTSGQIQVMKAIAKEHGVELPKKLTFSKKLKKQVWSETMSEAVIKDILKDKTVPTIVKRILRIRALNGSATVKKFNKTLNFAEPIDGNPDRGFCRELLLYYGAGTGRWAGKALQPHNFKRGPAVPQCVIDKISTGSYEEFLKWIDGPEGNEDIFLASPWNEKKKALDTGYFEQIYGKLDDDNKGQKFCGVVKALGTAVKPIIFAPEGEKFVVSDFAGIEARVLQWLCGHERMLQLFRDGADIYVDMACKIFACSPGEVDKKIRRQIGKVAVLGLGYQMGAKKFVANVKAQIGMDIDLEFSSKIVGVFRATQQPVVKLWKNIEKACIMAVRDGKTIDICKGKLRIRKEGEYLTIRLPSGRKLYYYKPQVNMEENAWGKESPKLTYLQKKGRQDTYGGKLVENVVQAISRCLLVDAMFRINERYKMALHVHDETVTRCKLDDKDCLPFVEKCMTTVADWAAGCPVGAESHECIRYTK